MHEQDRAAVAVRGVLPGGSKAVLLGRTTYEEFAPSWSTRTAEEDPGAVHERRPQIRVSASLQRADWSNSTILGPYRAETIRSLKGQIGGGIYVSGSRTRVQALLADGLVDELHLFVFPLALGTGRRLFADGAAPIKLALTDCRTYTSGVAYLTYTPAGS
jgi:dihydrofolate reductase